MRITKDALQAIGAILESGGGLVEYKLKGKEKTITAHKIEKVLGSRWPKHPSGFETHYLDRRGPEYRGVDGVNVPVGNEVYRKMDIEIDFGEEGEDSKITVESTDSTWLNATVKEIEEILDGIRTKREWVKHGSLRFVVAVLVALPFVYGFVWGLSALRLTQQGFQDRITLTGFITFFAGLFGQEKMILLWPYIELDGYSSYRNAKRIISLVVLAVISGIIYDLLRQSLTVP